VAFSIAHRQHIAKSTLSRIHSDGSVTLSSLLNRYGRGFCMSDWFSHCSFLLNLLPTLFECGHSIRIRTRGEALYDFARPLHEFIVLRLAMRLAGLSQLSARLLHFGQVALGLSSDSILALGFDHGIGDSDYFLGHGHMLRLLYPLVEGAFN
jgi:hypothetical protein